MASFLEATIAKSPLSEQVKLDLLADVISMHVVEGAWGKRTLAKKGGVKLKRALEADEACGGRDGGLTWRVREVQCEDVEDQPPEEVGACFIYSFIYSLFNFCDFLI